MNKKCVIQGLIMLMFVQMTYAQIVGVGVNTDTPRATLDVEGSMRVTKDIKLGAESGTAGDPGNEGDGFASQGPDKNPVWTPLMSGMASGYRIAESIVLNDQGGFLDNSSSPITDLRAQYMEGSSISENRWVELTGLRADITPKTENNRVVITLQTVGQSGAKTGITADLVLAVGIFIDDKLRSVRPISVYGSSMAFSIATLFDSFQDLKPKTGGASYSIKVGVALRYKNVTGGSGPTAWYALVGRSDPNVTNTTGMMNKTSLKIDLYEEIIP